MPPAQAQQNDPGKRGRARVQEAWPFCGRHQGGRLGAHRRARRRPRAGLRGHWRQKLRRAPVRVSRGLPVSASLCCACKSASSVAAATAAAAAAPLAPAEAATDATAADAAAVDAAAAATGAATGAAAAEADMSD